MDRDAISPIAWRWTFFILIAALIYGVFSLLLDPGLALLPAVIVWIVVVSTLRGGREPTMVPQDKVGISDGNVAHGTDGHDLGNFDPNRD